MTRIPILIAPTIICGLVAASQSAADRGKMIVVGFAEHAAIPQIGLRLKAKMDTGAKTTSIHAVNVERFKRNGKDWVHFTVRAGGRNFVLERRVIRISRIRRTKVGVVERPVVLLGICVAGYYKRAQVNLTDRTGMNYPLLIGRRFMSTGQLVIASSVRFRGKAECRGAPIKKSSD